jgi:hypothetical protein
MPEFNSSLYYYHQQNISTTEVSVNTLSIIIIIIFLQISDYENKNYELFHYEHFQILKTTKLHEKQV